MEQVNSINNISDKSFIIKYGQDFCIPCEMAENNLKVLETDYPNIKFYSTKNVDEAVEKGYKALPVLVLSQNGNVKELSDNTVLMNQESLKEWIDNNMEGEN